MLEFDNYYDNYITTLLTRRFHISTDTIVPLSYHCSLHPLYRFTTSFFVYKDCTFTLLDHRNKRVIPLPLTLDGPLPTVYPADRHRISHNGWRSSSGLDS